MEDKKQISLEIPYREKISRLFIFRALWGFPLMFVVMVWGIWVGIISFVHFFYQLILGKRHKWMWDQNAIFFKWLTRWNAYFNLIVDERPQFVETE